MKTLSVKEIPIDIENFENTLFEIVTNDVSYYTHGLFKYPCKFIPHIPKWAISKYSKEGDLILDPFVGSGTTAVEAVLNNRDSIGVDFDYLSKLLSQVKTEKYTRHEIQSIGNFLEYIENESFVERVDELKLPSIKNLNHWFSQKTIYDLYNLKVKIETYANTDLKIKNFLLVVFASIIRKCSYADDASPKPYVSKNVKKLPLDVYPTFSKNLLNYINEISKNSVKNFGTYKNVGNDARELTSSLEENSINLAITSPPYINAFDYVRSLRLENAWLGYYGDDKSLLMKKKQIGTESFNVKEYSKSDLTTGIKNLDAQIEKIKQVDRKRAFIVYKYFQDMNSNLSEVYKVLKSDAHYVIVIGNSKIRGQEIPTHEYLINLALNNGFKLENKFSYVIRNRYLRIPRNGKGGLINNDWVLNLKK